MKNNKNILEVKNLSKIFSNKGSMNVAVDSVNFELKQGETIGLIGESGSGKTTIGRTIIRLHNPTSGQVIIEGVDVAANKLSKEENKVLRESTQMIFQDPYSSLNEQKNIISIVSEPLEILKHDQKLLNELLDLDKKVHKFFSSTLSGTYYNQIFEFKNFKSDLANKTYDRIIKSLKSIKLNKKTKKENFELLFSVYYDLKEEANLTIVNEVLSIASYLFEAWKKAQEKVRSGKLDSPLEKKVLKQMDIYNEIKLLASHSKRYVETKEEYDELKEHLNKYQTLYNYEKRKSTKILENVLSEWKNNSKVKLLQANQEKDISVHNFIYLDYLIAHELYLTLKKIEKKTVFVKDDLTEQITTLYEAFKTKLKKHFEIQSQEKIKLLEKEHKNLLTIEPFLKPPLEKLIRNNVFEHDKAQKIVFDIFIKGNTIKNIKSFKDLKSKVEDLKSKVNLYKKDEVDEDIKLKLEKAKEVYERVLEESQLAEKEFKDKYKAELESKESERKIILAKKEALLEKKSLEAEKLFEEKMALIKSLILSNFNLTSDQSQKVFQKWLKKSIAKHEDENSALDNEIKYIYKDLNLMKKFMTNDLDEESKLKQQLIKYKLKKMLVRDKVYKALEDSGLTKAHAYRYPHEFSGGMRQRVGIARAIISQPKIIIADEPIAALDLSIQAQIVNMLKSLQKRDNMSMIFIAHDLSMVKYISDRLLIIHLGKIVETGTSKEIFENPIHPYTKNLIASMPDISHISKGFDSNNFQPTYLKEYSPVNVPKYYNITKTHQVLADEKQIKKWK